MLQFFLLLCPFGKFSLTLAATASSHVSFQKKICHQLQCDFKAKTRGRKKNRCRGIIMLWTLLATAVTSTNTIHCFLYYFSATGCFRSQWTVFLSLVCHFRSMLLTSGCLLRCQVSPLFLIKIKHSSLYQTGYVFAALLCFYVFCT